MACLLFVFLTQLLSFFEGTLLPARIDMETKQPCLRHARTILMTPFQIAVSSMGRRSPHIPICLHCPQFPTVRYGPYFCLCPRIPTHDHISIPSYSRIRLPRIFPGEKSQRKRLTGGLPPVTHRFPNIPVVSRCIPICVHIFPQMSMLGGSQPSGSFSFLAFERVVVVSFNPLKVSRF